MRHSAYPFCGIMPSARQWLDADLMQAGGQMDHLA